MMSSNAAIGIGLQHSANDVQASAQRQGADECLPVERHIQIILIFTIGFNSTATSVDQQTWGAPPAYCQWEWRDFQAYDKGMRQMDINQYFPSSLANLPCKV